MVKSAVLHRNETAKRGRLETGENDYEKFGKRKENCNPSFGLLGGWDDDNEGYWFVLSAAYNLEGRLAAIHHSA